MRRRLLTALTVFAALAVLAFAVPLSLTAATSRTQQFVLGRSGDADRFATLADAAGSASGVRALADEVGRYHELYGENVLVVDARGAPIVNAGVEVSDPRIRAAVAAARRNQRPQQVDRLTPWSAPIMLIARPVGTGVQVNGAVVIEASTTAARSAIARTWAVIVLGALGCDGRLRAVGAGPQSMGAAPTGRDVGRGRRTHRDTAEATGSHPGGDHPKIRRAARNPSPRRVRRCHGDGRSRFHRRATSTRRRYRARHAQSPRRLDDSTRLPGIGRLRECIGDLPRCERGSGAADRYSSTICSSWPWHKHPHPSVPRHPPRNTVTRRRSRPTGSMPGHRRSTRQEYS